MDTKYLKQKVKQTSETYVQPYIDAMRDEARIKAEERGIVISNAHNNEADAFRHVYTSAKVTRDYGAAAARVMGTGNEIIHPSDANERFMDEYNNTVGREIGQRAQDENWSDDQIVDEVKKAIDDGRVLGDINQVPVEVSDGESQSVPKENNIDKSSLMDSFLGLFGLGKSEDAGSEPAGAVNEIVKGDDVWREHVGRGKSVADAGWLRGLFDNKREQERVMQQGQGMEELPDHMRWLLRSVGGEVTVHGYSRVTGYVRAHTRSRPDGDEGNNLSFRMR